MKPREQKPETCFRIIDRETGKPVGSYSRAYCDEYDFNSADEARAANCHGIFKDKQRYAIAKYKVTYELLDDDVDGKPMVAAPPCQGCGGPNARLTEDPYLAELYCDHTPVWLCSRCIENRLADI